MQLHAALAALPAPWVVLANRRASGAEGPPWVRFIALRPGKGIALVDVDLPDGAVAPLEDFLDRAGFPAPPIVPVAIGGDEVGAVADKLEAAFEPAQSTIGNSNWCERAVRLLLAAPELALMRLRRAALSKYPSDAVEAWHELLARNGALRPDSALLDWPPPQSWRLPAVVAALLLVTIGARAVQEFGPSRFHAIAPPRSTAAAAPRTSADVLPRAMILPAPLSTVAVATTTLPAIEKPPPTPPVATLTPPRQTIVTPQPATVVTPRPKPATPAWFADTDNRPHAPRRPKIAAKPFPAVMSLAISDPAPKRDGRVNPAWYDQDATTPSNAGLTAFVAPGARNADLIPANLGTARLASGTTATLDFYGDGLVNIAISGQALARAIDPSTGKPLGAAVSHTRTLKAARGNVLVGANVAANVVDDVINTSGVVQASSASERNGQIVLDGGSGGSDVTVHVAGTKPPSDDPRGGKAAVGGGPAEDQGVVYATASVTVAQDTTAEAKSIAGSVGSAATDANALTTSADTAIAGAPANVTRTVGAVGSTLTSTVNALTKPVTSLAPALR